MERKVVTRAPHREVGVVNPGWLLDHAVEHESHLERRFIMVALSCPVVVDIIHQPLHIELEPGGKSRYTPDFLIRFKDDDELLVEVKPSVFVRKHAERLEQAHRRFALVGKKFLVVTEKHIDEVGLSARAMLLMRYGRLRMSDEEAMVCYRILKEHLSWEFDIRDLVKRGLPEPLIWNMVARHQLRVPVGLSMSQDEKVAINDITEDCCDYFHTWIGAQAR